MLYVSRIYAYVIVPCLCIYNAVYWICNENKMDCNALYSLFIWQIETIYTTSRKPKGHAAFNIPLAKPTNQHKIMTDIDIQSKAKRPRNIQHAIQITPVEHIIIRRISVLLYTTHSAVWTVITFALVLNDTLYPSFLLNNSLVTFYIGARLSAFHHILLATFVLTLIVVSTASLP